MAYLNCFVSPSPATGLSSLPQIGLGLLPLLLIIASAGIRILYIRSLQRAQERCSGVSRAISPEAIWLLLVPVFSAFWHFLVVSRLATSLGSEFGIRNLPHAGPKPGKRVGMAMCLLPIVAAIVFAIPWLPFPSLSVTGRVALSLKAIWLASAIAGLICWIVYWVMVEGYSKALAKPYKAGAVASPDPGLRPKIHYLLIGIAGLTVFLALSLPSAVGFLIFEATGRAAASADSYAAVYPRWYSRYLFTGEFVSQQRVSQMARQQLQRQNPQYANIPQIVNMVEARAGQHLVQQQVLLIEAGRLGIRVSKSDVDQFLRQGQIGEVLYPNGQYIGDERYAALIATHFNFSVKEFEEELKGDMVVRRLQALITAGVQVSDAEVRDAYRKQNTKIRFDYAVISADELRGTINPTDSDLEAFFNKNATRYAAAVPEQRRIAYFAFTPQEIPGGPAQPSQQEIQQYFTAHQAEYTVPEQARSRHILILARSGSDAATDAKARSEAEALLRQIQGGANFADLARKFSDDTGSKDKGGELGFARRGMMVPEFDNAIFSQRIGDVQIVKTKFGYHLVQVEERQPARTQPLSEVQSSIQTTLLRQKLAAAEESYARALASEAAKNGLEKTAAAHRLQLAATPLISTQSPIAAFPDSSRIMAIAFQFKRGDAPQFAPTGDGYAIFQVTDIVPAHAPAFADWKSSIIEDYRTGQLPALLIQKTRELAEKAKAENDLAKAAQEVGATLKSSDLLGFGSQAPDLGPVGQAAPQLFDLPVGSISEPINAQRTGVVAKILDKQEPSAEEIARNFDQVKNQILEQRRADAFNIFVSDLMDDYKKHDRIQMNAKAKSDAKSQAATAK
jgi:peptidyl-prolyl cis-trans isomerase D